MLYAGICVWIFSLPSAPAAAEPGPAGARPRERWDADDDNDENGDDSDDDDGRNQPPKTTQYCMSWRVPPEEPRLRRAPP